MSAALAIEGAVHVCSIDLIKAEKKDRRLYVAAGSASIEITSREHAQMACAANINGAISGFTAGAQYLSDTIFACPPPADLTQHVKDGALCSMGINLLISGTTKSMAALSDVKEPCKDPQYGDVPYSQPLAKGREQYTLAGCLNACGQATTYLAKIGYSLDAITTACPKNPDSYQRAECDNQIGGLLANIGQVATYLSAASAICGPTVLTPFACVNRIAATITGFADIAQAGGVLYEGCEPKSENEWWTMNYDGHSSTNAPR
ncbi:unnamed protein product [Polarella glacialis]|uniref:Uncharacterized protein n=1 Tax=Polarella glacialis TaxID=89957 RepID=A0A813JPT7_POLGL|nr:unnamed protein product [Polarella glacialis]